MGNQIYDIKYLMHINLVLLSIVNSNEIILQKALAQNRNVFEK